jgi:hypothetical protein
MRRAALALLLAAGSGSAAACALELLDAAGGTTLARVPVPSAFSLAYLHSVSLRQVESRYVLRGNAIVQTAEVFDHYGPGMSGEPLPGERLEARRDAGGAYYVLHMSRPIARLVVRLHERPAFRLMAGDQSLALDRLAVRSIELRPDCGSDAATR